MVKRMVISGLAAIVIGASGVGAYEAVQSSSAENQNPSADASTEASGYQGGRDDSAALAQGGEQGQQSGQSEADSQDQGQGGYQGGQTQVVSQSQGQGYQGGQNETDSQSQGRGNWDGQDEADARSRGWGSQRGQDDASSQGQEQGYQGGENGTDPQGLGDGSQEPQAPIGEWMTLMGTITGLEQNGLAMSTGDNQTHVLELGPPWFWSSQDVTFEIGDEVEVLGFEADEGYGPAFHAATITRVSDGATIELRDSTGQPLWGGPGGH